MNYPGIDNVVTNRIFRMTGSTVQHRLGVGFMKKTGIREDQIDVSPTYYALCYVIRGRGEYITRGNSYPLRPGSVFQRFPGLKHSTILDPDSDWAECFIDFGPAFCETLSEIGVLRKDMPVFSIRPMITYEKNVYGLMVDLERAQPQELPGLILRALELTGKIYSARIGKDMQENENFVRQACELLKTAAVERSNLRILIEANGWGYEWFRKKFREQLGISPGQYILRHRLELASNLILSTNLNFGQIADKLGYQNQYEFSAQFKKYIGQSPGQYRKQHSLPV